MVCCISIVTLIYINTSAATVTTDSVPSEALLLTFYDLTNKLLSLSVAVVGPSAFCTKPLATDFIFSSKATTSTNMTTSTTNSLAIIEGADSDSHIELIV